MNRKNTKPLGKPRIPVTKARRFPPGSGIAYSYLADENGRRTPRTCLGAGREWGLLIFCPSFRTLTNHPVPFVGVTWSPSPATYWSVPDPLLLSSRRALYLGGRGSPRFLRGKRKVDSARPPGQYMTWESLSKLVLAHLGMAKCPASRRRGGQRAQTGSSMTNNIRLSDQGPELPGYNPTFRTSRPQYIEASR